MDGKRLSDRETQQNQKLEKSKEMIVEEVFGGQRLSQMKRVRLSLDLKMISSHQEKKMGEWRHSIFSNYSSSSSSGGKSAEFSTLGDVLKHMNSSRGSTCSTSSSRKSLSLIPRYVLENINDEKLLLKNSQHRISIEIVNLIICENSSMLTNENSKFIYIEYTFLGYKGHLMETQSLQKPTKAGEALFYHFENTFEIRPSEDKRQFKILKSMLEKKSKVPIKFMIISEPLDNQENGECEEIG